MNKSALCVLGFSNPYVEYNVVYSTSLLFNNIFEVKHGTSDQQKKRSRRHAWQQKAASQRKAAKFRFQNSPHHKSVSSRSFKEKFPIYTGEQLNWYQVIFRLASSVIPGILLWVLLCGGYGFLIALINLFWLFISFS